MSISDAGIPLQRAAKESKEELENALRGADLVVVTVGIKMCHDALACRVFFLRAGHHTLQQHHSSLFTLGIADVMSCVHNCHALMQPV